MALLGIGNCTYLDWKTGRLHEGLDGTALERLSHLFGIYSCLQLLLPIPERADAWIRRPNSAPPFAGNSALHRMLGGHISDLIAVREYLHAQRDGAPSD
ncbi:antitoxin Xre/MbcA/ParS toxin-binding domain-containing protein [Lysobacter sp. FW306-1B-D06B]|uniref:antitoxin Xre/MbcA/ParS toxin-binding domain-containing protein n=1 Tax=Lysobacter sp. FW306-1B-D06B TaxID=3140250 RepID=UPI0031407A65